MTNLRQRRTSEMKSSVTTQKEDTAETVPLIGQNEAVSADDKANNHDGYQIRPLRVRPTLARLDVAPFLLLYSALIVMDIYVKPESDNQNGSNAAVQMLLGISFPLALLAHICLFLFQQWNVHIKSHVGYQRMQLSPAVASSWTHCLVEAPHMDKHQSSNDAEICKVLFQRTSDGTSVATVNFQDIIFRYNQQVDVDITLWQAAPKSDASKPASFQRLSYPINMPLRFYSAWKGHRTVGSVVEAQHLYGTNSTPIEPPPFLELLQEQLVAPFFLFQVLCVILWSLDEYWYYAIFTFCAILLFESTVAFNRLKGLQRVRSHTSQDALEKPVWVYRPGFPPQTNNWVKVRSAEIVPGDVISIKHLIARRSDAGASLNRIPADILVLEGDAVVDESLLTGESIPQLKVPLNEAGDDQPSHTPGTADEKCTYLDLQEHKQSILFGGTILQVSHGSGDGSARKGLIPPPPDDGAVGFIIRTGFDTAQGSLLRTLAHTQKSVEGIHTKDTYIFILVLMCCALGCAITVWNEGSQDPSRNQFKLLLHVIMIVTIVVPPELPMELSLAVTNSVADLMKRCQVYCTEVFRIPLAGQVDVCCFDKTGTLTSDEMQLKGVYVPTTTEGVTRMITNLGTELPWVAERVMAGCHSLAIHGTSTRAQNGMVSIIGDPLEKTVLERTNYRMVQNNAVSAVDTSAEKQGRPSSMLILRRFGFSSRLKRMSVIVKETNSPSSWVLMKGAPEKVKSFLVAESIPEDYDKVYMDHMGLGQRVLAMAYKEFGATTTLNTVHAANREDIESDMVFAGFLLLDCPIKPDSKSVVSELRNSGHMVSMITGDAVLTAAEVARQVGIISSSHQNYTLQQKSGGGFPADPLDGFVFLPLRHDENSATTTDELKPNRRLLKTMQKEERFRDANFCITGGVLQQLTEAILRADGSNISVSLDEKQTLMHPKVQEVLADLVPNISVFARHAPRQKEAIVAAFNLGGFHTLMCGDGTNDVGALRRAHVGISIISAPGIEAKHRSAVEAISKARKQNKKSKKSKQPSGNSDRSSLAASLRQLQEAQDDLDHVELGDASIASPFTARTVSIKCCKDVLQQGRCTLLTMLQIYKILGINCLVNAMVLSKLFLHGVKQGDRQLTILDLSVASLFFFVTRGKPLPDLAPIRPPSSVLCRQAIASIIVQVTIHCTAIWIATEVTLSFVDPFDPSMIPDGPFNPNTLNTCTFLMNALSVINTFAVNYRGRPFMEDLRDNKLMFRTLLACYGVLFACALEIFPPLNDLLQLTEFPSTSATTPWSDSEKTQLVVFPNMPVFMSVLMVGDTLLVFAAERFLTRVFES